MLVYSEEKQTYDSNRLHYFAEHYQPVDQKVNFKKCESFDELIEKLKEMNSLHFHLIGTRGYVYHSASMIQVIMAVKSHYENNPSHQITFWNLLTRTGGLREIAIKLYRQERPSASKQST